MRRRWIGIPLAVLMVAGLAPSVSANSEMHPAARLFYPLWDVSTPNRLTFIVVTREPLRAGTTISPVPTGTFIGFVPTIINRFKVQGTPGNCIPRGAGGSSLNVNRTDLGGTSTTPVFVDDLHFEWYGKSCLSADETVHMSCADIDLFLLASPDNAAGLRPRRAFAAVAGEGRGALDVHLILNGQTNPNQRKDDPYGGFLRPKERSDRAGSDKWHSVDNSLMGHAIISDLAEGWAATYPAAAAKTTTCGLCGYIDGGTRMGYENYPMEVMLPFALADPFNAVPSGSGAPLRNILSLWGPGLFAGANLQNTTINLDWAWWDGRERAFTGSVIAHSLIRPLGGDPIAGLDPPIDSSGFNVANFVCGHTGLSGRAENDGFPRTGTNAAACGAPDVPDTAHPSDNFESNPDITSTGHSIQSSTPIGWWRFVLRRDGQAPQAVQTATISCDQFDDCAIPDIKGYQTAHSGRGLVGVVLSHTVGASGNGVGDATRFWHKNPCHKASSGTTVGPVHVPHWSDVPGDDPGKIALFNVYSLRFQYERICKDN
jgi:hypothetical protein